MGTYSVLFECGSGHRQEITFRDLPREWVEVQAGLLDGTSPLFAHPPVGTESPIGKCGICGGQLRSTIREVGE